MERELFMSTLIESYNQIYLNIKESNERIRQIEETIQQKSVDHSGNIKLRISKLEEQIEKIEEYLLKVKGFQELAKKNLESQNVLTIEAPPGYRVNLNRLRNWAMMIDPQSSNDPYAQRVFVVSKCDEHFLEQKKKEFSERIQQLKQSATSEPDDEIIALRNEQHQLQMQQDLFCESEQNLLFLRDVLEENKRYWIKSAPDNFPAPNNFSELIAPGAYAARLPFEGDRRAWLKNHLGDYYDEKSGRAMLPVEFSNNTQFVLDILCTPSRRHYLDRGLRNFLLLSLQLSPAGMRKLFIIDAERFSAASIGSLRQLEDSFVMARVPRNPEQIISLLEEMISSYADMDEAIEQFDSVTEYNSIVEPDKRLPLQTLVLFGWPNAYDGRAKELIQRIMTNYERYGVSLICVRYGTAESERNSENNSTPSYVRQNACHIAVQSNQSTITFTEGKPQSFVWYTFTEELSDAYVQSLLRYESEKAIIGNEYTDRYSLVDLPAYTREYKKLEIPFGIDGKDEAHCVSFENENFATYLVGASRSGKSTLLHTLIAGLIRSYHPDNLELWLADFKQLEFKRYINHLPPHVKYVLLDESTELVFDLVDKLTAEMMQRQKLFSRLGVQRIDQIDTTVLDKPLPLIFVILDEFSIMSQSIAESPVYKLRLQNILAKGAALGIRFLFSSQTFTSGVSGLTTTARAQIQQRIAMKGSREEISETLELSSNLKTDQVRNWMDALPPHYALVKFRTGADTLPVVKRYLVMYFRDYTPRDEMIERIRNRMMMVEDYQPTDINTYTNKKPVLVDGNTYESFDRTLFQTEYYGMTSDKSNDFAGDELFFSFGSPRLMERMKLAILSSETRENVLLVSRAAECACAASVLMSAIKSTRISGGTVEIWAYERNILFKMYRNVFETENVRIVLGMDSVCEAIRNLKRNIEQKHTAKKLILLVGMERICMDFEFVDDGNHTKKSIYLEKRRQLAENETKLTPQQEYKKQYAAAWVEYRNKFKSRPEIVSKSSEEQKRLLSEEQSKFFEQYTLDHPYPKENDNTQTVQESVNHVEEKTKVETHKHGAYQAQEDFKYVVMQGSRLGYHFLMQLQSLSDVKTCGLKIDYFRYRMAFQLSADDSRLLFNNKVASTLPEHICQFDDTLGHYSFRPYLHHGIDWEGWSVDENETVINPYEQ